MRSGKSIASFSSQRQVPADGLWYFRLDIVLTCFSLQNWKEMAHTDQPLKEGNVHISAPHIYGSVLEALELSVDSSMTFLNAGSGTCYLSCLAASLCGPRSSIFCEIRNGVAQNPTPHSNSHVWHSTVQVSRSMMMLSSTARDRSRPGKSIYQPGVAHSTLTLSEVMLCILILRRVSALAHSSTEFTSGHQLKRAIFHVSSNY
jgi:hypothetical protein